MSRAVLRQLNKAHVCVRGCLLPAHAHITGCAGGASSSGPASPFQVSAFDVANSMAVRAPSSPERVTGGLCPRRIKHRDFNCCILAEPQPDLSSTAFSAEGRFSPSRPLSLSVLATVGTLAVH